jgi:NAD(P)-dependent dehydrogenase (short-subunit alcohol dehydrogenase family)
MGLLDRKVVLVTGGARGIGAATALCCAQEGAIVVTCDLNERTGADTAAKITARGGSAKFVQADISDEASVHELFSVIRTTYGQLDGAVNKPSQRSSCPCHNRRIKIASAVTS